MSPGTPSTEAGRSLMAFMDQQVGCGDLLADVLAIEAEAGRLDADRLTRAVMAAVGSSHPDDFGIAYRDKRGFSPSGLAAAISEEWARGPQVRGGG